MMRSRISSPVVSFPSGFQMHNVDVSSTNGLECIRSATLLMASAKSRSAGAVCTGFDAPTISSICTRPASISVTRSRSAAFWTIGTVLPRLPSADSSHARARAPQAAVRHRRPQAMCRGVQRGPVRSRPLVVVVCATRHRTRGTLFNAQSCRNRAGEAFNFAGFDRNAMVRIRAGHRRRGLPDVKPIEPIAIDCRGHGQSGKPRDASQYAHIVGYSMGGAIATQLLVRHPERLMTVTLLGAGWEGENLPQGFRSQMLALADAFASKDASALIRSVTSSGQNAPALEEVAALNASLFARNDPQVLGAATRGLLPLYEISAERLRAVRLPVLAIVGAHDSFGVQGVKRMVLCRNSRSSRFPAPITRRASGRLPRTSWRFSRSIGATETQRPTRLAGSRQGQSDAHAPGGQGGGSFGQQSAQPTYL
jgi:pimeloyl-ACP methyl ester carboxylesterase